MMIKNIKCRHREHNSVGRDMHALLYEEAGVRTSDTQLIHFEKDEL